MCYADVPSSFRQVLRRDKILDLSANIVEFCLSDCSCFLLELNSNWQTKSGRWRAWILPRYAEVEALASADESSSWTCSCRGTRELRNKSALLKLSALLFCLYCEWPVLPSQRHFERRTRFDVSSSGTAAVTTFCCSRSRRFAVWSSICWILTSHSSLSRLSNLGNNAL